MYKCLSCGKQFVIRKKLDENILWEEYTKGKQTYAQLAEKYGCSSKTIKRTLDRAEISYRPIQLTKVNVVMDTTYWGRNFGVMVFKDSKSSQTIHKKFVKYETNKLYKEGIESITKMGITILSIVCDGRKGLLQMFPDIPVQMCQFHQLQIITRYLTRNPKHEASKELRKLSLQLTKVSKKEFEESLDDWFLNWNEYLNERTLSDETGKSFYTHRRLRSAYFSLRRNLKYLFVFEDFKEIEMSNTTNCLDGTFAELKKLLRNHNGLNIKRKQKFIDGFFKA